MQLLIRPLMKQNKMEVLPEERFLNFIKRTADVFKTRSSSTITSVIPGAGFSELDMNMNRFVTIGCEYKEFKDYIAVVPEELNLQKNVVEAFNRKINCLLASTSTQYETFALNFKSNEGGNGQMIVCFGRNNKKDKLIDFGLVSTRAKFMLAPITVTMHHEKSGFLYEKSWDEIIEKPSPLEEKQIECLYYYMCTRMLSYSAETLFTGLVGDLSKYALG